MCKVGWGVVCTWRSGFRVQAAVGGVGGGVHTLERKPDSQLHPKLA